MAVRAILDLHRSRRVAIVLTGLELVEMEDVFAVSSPLVPILVHHAQRRHRCRV